MKHLLTIILLSALTLAHLSGQPPYSTRSKKAISLYENGYKSYSLRNYEQAEKEMKAALRADRNFVEPYFILAEISSIGGRHSQAIDYYRQSIKINPEYHPEVYLYLAEQYIRLAGYAEAISNLEICLESDGLRQAARQHAGRLLASCLFAIEAVKHPVAFEPMNLGDSVNTEMDEYWPSLTADEEKLVFTRLVPNPFPSQPGQGKMQEDFYQSIRTDSVWSLAKNLGQPLNTPWNEGAQSVTADGQYMFFTACGRDNGLGSCDIYISRRTEHGWGTPQNLGPPVNSPAWESQPSISPDGKTLYFVSNRKAGKGKMDIWMSTLTAEGRWGEPVNLGDMINTPEDEMSPFIHHDNRTLYFASSGHPGMGGLDLFRAQKDEKDKWAAPENLGYPINTQFDETGLVVNAPGNRAYYASDRLKGKGRDIYSFELYPEIRPDPVTYMKGIVYDSITMHRLVARFELIDLETASLTMEAWSDRNGEFLVCIPSDRDYALNVSRKGYLFYSGHFSLTGHYSSLDPFEKDVPMVPIRVGEATVLNNVFFEFDSDKLLPASTAELDKLVDFLEQNPALEVELGGHTDETGTHEYNMDLSMRRARSVYRYLTLKGIDEKRLSYMGYGKTRPVDTNLTPEGRARNRRTELTITGIK